MEKKKNGKTFPTSYNQMPQKHYLGVLGRSGVWCVQAERVFDIALKIVISRLTLVGHSIVNLEGSGNFG